MLYIANGTCGRALQEFARLERDQTDPQLSILIKISVPLGKTLKIISLENK